MMCSGLKNRTLNRLPNPCALALAATLGKPQEASSIYRIYYSRFGRRR